MVEQLHDIEIDRKVPAVMRDGTTLYSDVYRPKTPGRYPVIVERVAYELDSRLEPYAEFYARRGYVFVGQNTRGTFWSEGEFRGVQDDGWGDNRDGYDTIEWAAQQSWSDGNIGTMDGSWSGITQVYLAPTRPPHLRTMFARMPPTNRAEANGGIPGVGLRVGLLQHTLERARHPSAPTRLKSFLPAIEQALDDPMAMMNELPSGGLLLVSEIYPELGDVFGAKPNDPRRLDSDATRQAHEISVPAFWLGGWFDAFLQDTIKMYSIVRTQGYSERARINQRLLIGPWVHGPMQPDNSLQGDIDFGPEAVLGINEFRLKWFDFWLKGIQNDAQESAPVRLFVMGENRWRDFDDWPPEGATSTNLYLHEDDEQSLQFEPPAVDSSETSYDYDPFDPVGYFGGGKAGFAGNGPIDMSSAEGELAVFTSAPLREPLTAIGPITMRLWAKSSARDTDWFVTLCDVHPDGRSMRVTDGSLRARYKDGFDRESLLEPGKPYLFDFELSPTAQRFEAGHRIRISITSSQFPPLARNMNTGGENAEETAGTIAHNTILHDREHPSHVVLPVMD